MTCRGIRITSFRRQRTDQRAYTVVETLVAVVILAIMLVSLYGGFTSGFAVVQVARENLRATQIMVQRIETLRLYNWEQVRNTSNFLKPAFTNWYDPSDTSKGTVYVGFVTTNAPAISGAAYSSNMRAVTVTVYWTNQIHGNNTPLVRTRQMQTYVARYGMQSYLYQ